jgi:cytochrome c
MRELSGTWTRERLDAFLANPRGVVPGTTMQFPGMADAAERARLIDYLETLKF